MNLNRIKQKIILFLFFTIVLIFFSIYFILNKSFTNDNTTLNVYNWGSVLSDGSGDSTNINEIFTKETGIKINYTTYQNNEEMYTKITQDGSRYDVIFPSDYLISKLIKEKLIKKLNFNNIPNYSLIDSKHKRLKFDPKNEYSVPYIWGVIGIFYNSKYINDYEIDWDILWNKKYKNKILYFDNIRDAFGVSLLRLKKSVNSSEPNDWIQAYNELSSQRDVVQKYMSDQFFDKLNTEEAWVAPFYSVLNISEIIKNPHIKFAIPKSGTNKFVDSACIPINSKHQKEAEIYINFLCRKDIALENMMTTGNLSPQIEVNEEISESDYFENYNLINSFENTEVYTYLNENITNLSNELWINFKTIRKSSNFEKVLLLCVMLFLIFFKRLQSLFRFKK